MQDQPKRMAFDSAAAVLSDISGLATGRRALIAISGLSGSGKTTLARAIKKRLASVSVRCSMIVLDHYYRDWDDCFLPWDDAGRPIYDKPESYHFGEFASAVARLLKGQAIEMPIFDKASLMRLDGPGTIVEPSPVIIAEGLFAIDFLRDSYIKRRAGISRFVYVEASPDLCLKRLIVRNQADFDTDAEFSRRRFNDMVLPYFEKHLLPQRDQADFVIENERE